MLPCLSKKLFGFDCLGCGFQRSVSLLFQGEFIEAFYMYPAIYSLILLFITIGIKIVFKLKKYNQIINTLAIISISTILINYTLKIII